MKNKKFKIIGLTGQSGAGKSTISRLLAEQSNISVINADDVVQRLYKSESACLRAVCSVFGSDIINSDGSLNRPVLAQRAFSSKENTRLLNSIVHPFVIADFLRQIKEYSQSGAELIVLDAPQLFESNADVLCDVIIAVTASVETRLERIIKRDFISAEQAKMRINAQLDEEFFRQSCDYVIENNKDISDTKLELKRILQDLR